MRNNISRDKCQPIPNSSAHHPSLQRRRRRQRHHRKKNGLSTRACAWHIGVHVSVLYRVICMFVMAATEALPHLVRAINVYSNKNDADANVDAAMRSKCGHDDRLEMNGGVASHSSKKRRT